MLLYPDPRVREQPDNLTTCFAAPIHAIDFDNLMGKTARQGCEPNRDALNNMPFVMLEDDFYFMRSNGEDGYERIVIILRTNEDPDTCLESAAWIRIKYEYNGMIYICRQSPAAHFEWQTIQGIIAAGVDEKLVAMVDLISEDIMKLKT